MSQVQKITVRNMGCGGFTFVVPPNNEDPLKVTWLVENFDTGLRRVDRDLRGKKLIDTLTKTANWALETTFKGRKPSQFFEDLVDDLFLIAFANRSGYEVTNVKDAEEVIDFDDQGYPIGVKEPKASHVGELTCQRAVTGEAIARGVTPAVLVTSRVKDLICLGVLPELAAALEGLDCSVIHNGVIRYGNSLFPGKRYLVIDGGEAWVRVDNGEFESFEMKEIAARDCVLSIKFKQVYTTNTPLSVPIVLVRTKHGLDENCITSSLKEYTFIPGDSGNYQKALENLGEGGWYKVIKRRPLKTDVCCIAKYKTCIRNPKGNLLLFFHNGRCFEVSGKKEFTVTLQEVEVRT